MANTMLGSNSSPLAPSSIPGPSPAVSISNSRPGTPVNHSPHLNPIGSTPPTVNSANQHAVSSMAPLLIDPSSGPHPSRPTSTEQLKAKLMWWKQPVKHLQRRGQVKIS